MPVALEAKVEVATTAVGGSLIALLEAILGSGRAATSCATCAARPAPPARGRLVRAGAAPRRVSTATAAIAVWEERYGDPPPGVAELARRPASPARLAGQIASAAAAMGARRRQRARGASGGDDRDGAARARRLPSSPLRRRRSRRPPAILDVRVWSGPVEDRVRITDPLPVRAARFDHVFVASLQDGEFPAGGRRRPLPLRSDNGPTSACSRGATPRSRSATSSPPASPSPAAGSSSPTATATRTAPPRIRSPLLEEVERLLEPGEGRPRRGRELPRSSTASATRLRRPSWPAPSPPTGAGAEAGAAARRRRRSTPRPGPDRGEARARPRARGRHAGAGAAHRPRRDRVAGRRPRLRRHDPRGFRRLLLSVVRLARATPQPLDPPPDPLVQGGITHEVLQRLYQEPPAADRLPRPDPGRLARTAAS